MNKYDEIAAAPLAPVWISLVPRDVFERRIAAAEPAAPLAGLTFAVKDNIDVAGVPTTAACPAYAYTPSANAPVVAKLHKAGATAIGKTNMDQFATGLVGARSPYGQCASVFSPRHISGGSSSGSAVAVARGLADFALGTDTAGSGRVPAAFNGLVGLKPTRGWISAAGVVPACRTLDCVSIFTPTCELALRVFRQARGADDADSFSRDPRTGEDAAPWSQGPFRFGVPGAQDLEFFGDTASAALYEQALRKLESIGGERVVIDFTAFRETASLLYAGPWVAERYAAIETMVKDHAADMDPVVHGIIAGALRYSATDAFRANYRLQDLRRIAGAQWAGIDILALPTAPTIYTHEQIAADPVRLNTNLGYYTNIVNLLDLAAVAAPAGVSPAGLPFGITLMGPAFSDEGLLAVAGRYCGEGELLDAPPGCVPVAVVGAHLAGQPLNWQLTSVGSRLMRATRTAACYRLFALANSQPAKPGLIRESGFAGPGIEVEVWAVPRHHFGGFVAAIPPPLGIGTVELADGSEVKCFLGEQYALAGAQEITALGGWRKYRASL